MNGLWDGLVGAVVGGVLAGAATIVAATLSFRQERQALAGERAAARDALEVQWRLGRLAEMSDTLEQHAHAADATERARTRARLAVLLEVFPYRLPVLRQMFVEHVVNYGRELEEAGRRYAGKFPGDPLNQARMELCYFIAKTRDEAFARTYSDPPGHFAVGETQASPFPVPTTN